MKYLKLDAERVCPDPECEQLAEATWRAFHAPKTLTDADVLALASVAEMYRELMVGGTGRRATELVQTVRRLLKERARRVAKRGEG